MPYTWRSWVVPVWPRIASLQMRFPLDELALDSQRPLACRITYVGADLYQVNAPLGPHPWVMPRWDPTLG